MTQTQSASPVFSRRNKTLITIRAVASADAEAMQAFVTGLGAATRRFRFHGCVNGCAASFLRHLTDVDSVRHVAFVAYAGDTLVGEARYFLGAQNREAEFAIAVADAYQGRGVAAALMNALIRRARAAGIRHLYGDVLEDNERMAAFMRRQGFEIDLNGWETTEAGIVRWQRPVRRALRLPSLPRFAQPRATGLARVLALFGQRSVAL